MTPQEKKDLVLEKLEKGDKRSYNEIMADLELEIWTSRYVSRDEMSKLTKR